MRYTAMISVWIGLATSTAQAQPSRPPPPPPSGPPSRPPPPPPKGPPGMKQCNASLAVPSGAPGTVRYSGKWTCNVSGDRGGSATFIFMPGDHGTIEASSNVFLSGDGSATFTLVFQRRAASLYATLDATAWVARFVDKSTIKIDERSTTDDGQCLKLVYACTPK